MPDVDLERAERLAAELIDPYRTPPRQRAAATIRVLVERVRALERENAAWMVRDVEWVGVVCEYVGRVRALTEAGDVMAARLSVAIDEGRNVVPDATDDQSALIEAFAIEAVAAWEALAASRTVTVTQADPLSNAPEPGPLTPTMDLSGPG